MADSSQDLDQLLDSTFFLTHSHTLIFNYLAIFSLFLRLFHSIISGALDDFQSFNLNPSPPRLSFPIFVPLCNSFNLFYYFSLLNLCVFVLIELCVGSGGAIASKNESPSLPSGVQGLGMGLPDLRTKKKGKQKASKDIHVAEALNKLREQTKEAVKGLESMTPPAADDLGKDALMEDWVKQFEQLAGSQVFFLSFFSPLNQSVLDVSYSVISLVKAL